MFRGVSSWVAVNSSQVSLTPTFGVKVIVRVRNGARVTDRTWVSVRVKLSFQSCFGDELTGAYINTHHDHILSVLSIFVGGWHYIKY